MTVHRNRFLVNKTNRCTEFQFYWYYDSTCLGNPFCPSSGALSRTSAVVHFMQVWWPSATRSSMELKFHPTPGSKRCTAQNSWWWAERLPETCRVDLPIKLEFSASVGFIHLISLVSFNNNFLLGLLVTACFSCSPPDLNFLTWCFSDRASWIDYILITNFCALIIIYS